MIFVDIFDKPEYGCPLPPYAGTRSIFCDSPDASSPRLGEDEHPHVRFVGGIPTVLGTGSDAISQQKVSQGDLSVHELRREHYKTALPEPRVRWLASAT